MFRPDPKPIKVIKDKKQIRSAIKKMSTKKESYSVLKKKLDKVFNHFIRLRDSKGDHFVCISCNTPLPLTELQAGHYWSCTYTAIRWHEKNVNGQCRYCNVFCQGNFGGYTKGMIKKYGEDVLKLLDMSKNNKVKITAFEYKYLIVYYEEQIKKMQSPL